MPQRLLLLLLSTLAAAPTSAQTATVHAALDLRRSIEAGWFDADTETVGLRGNRAPLSWDATTRASDADGDGIYTATVEIPVAGDSTVLEYKIKVDGTNNPNDGWQIGSNHELVLQPGDVLEVALAFDDRPPEPAAVLTGRFDTVEGVEGEGLAPRTVWVWLPPGYDDTDRRYPVLYLHDGASMFGHGGGSEWGMDEAATALVEAGEIEPLILVAVENTPARTDEYTPTARTWERRLVRSGPPTGTGPHAAATGTFRADDGAEVVMSEEGDGLVAAFPGGQAPLDLQPDGTFRLPPDVTGRPLVGTDGAIDEIVVTRPQAGGLGDAYGRLLTDVVKPLIDARYRTRPEAEHTGVGGSSLGGLISMHLGLTRPDVFGRLLVASPSVWWDDKAILGSVAEAAPRPEQRIWIDMGLEEGDSMVPDARALYHALLDRGWDAERVTHVEAEGAGHETRAWQARAPDMLRFLFPPQPE